VDEAEFKHLTQRLGRVAKVIEKLPPEIRQDSFSLLKGYVTAPEEGSSSKKKPPSRPAADGHDSAESFFAAFDHAKPADNAKLIAAFYYREYGVEPFSIEEVRQTADDVGITIPARVDMTFRAAKEKGKKLFTAASKGKFKPTVYGEANLKTTYSVRKGTKKRDPGDE